MSEDSKIYPGDENSDEYYGHSGFKCYISAGFKYILNDSLSFQFFGAFNPAHGNGDVERIIGVGIDAFF